MFGNNNNNSNYNNRPNSGSNSGKNYSEDPVIAFIQKAMDSSGRGGLNVLAIVGPLLIIAWVAFTNIFRIVRDFWVTLLWIAAFWLAVNSHVSALGWLVVIVGLVMMVAGFVGPQFGEKYSWMEQFQRYAPVIADGIREKRKKAELAKKVEGQQFLLHTGILSMNEIIELDPDVEMIDYGDRKVFTLKKSIPRVNSKTVVSKAEEFQDYLNAVRAVPKPLHGTGGGVEITFYMTDPLDETFEIVEPAELNADTMTVECAIGSSGQKMKVVFGDNAGGVVAGVPGSGKSVGVNAFSVALAVSPYVALTVIDGKGGTDWTPYRGVAEEFVRGTEDLRKIHDLLEKKYNVMIDRVKTQEHTIGDPNFWNVSAKDRLKAGLRFELIVTDEAPTVFDTTGRDADEKKLIDRIIRFYAEIEKRGRSVGMFVLFLVQKATNDAIPTGLRDNAGWRIAFRHTSPGAEAAIMGATGGDGLSNARPTAIPAKRKGGAVLINESGEAEMVRFFMMKPQRTAEVLARGKMPLDMAERRQMALTG